MCPVPDLSTSIESSLQSPRAHFQHAAHTGEVDGKLVTWDKWPVGLHSPPNPQPSARYLPPHFRTDRAALLDPALGFPRQLCPALAPLSLLCHIARCQLETLFGLSSHFSRPPSPFLASVIAPGSSFLTPSRGHRSHQTYIALDEQSPEDLRWMREALYMVSPALPSSRGRIVGCSKSRESPKADEAAGDWRNEQPRCLCTS